MEKCAYILIRLDLPPMSFAFIVSYFGRLLSFGLGGGVQIVR